MEKEEGCATKEDEEGVRGRESMTTGMEGGRASF